MDINDLDKKVEQIREQLQGSHKRAIIWGIIILLVIILIALIVTRNRQPVNDLQVRALQDSIQVHDKKGLMLIQELSHTHDSAIAAIQDQQDNLQQQLISITNKYDKVRKQLASSTVDNRLHFFSDHLPSTTH